MLWKRVTVDSHERILVFRNGCFAAILSPGEYRVRLPEEIDIERHDIRKFVFRSLWCDFLIEQRPQLVERHFVKVETTETQVGLVYVNGSLYQVLTPAKQLLFWREAAHVTAEIVNVIPVRDNKRPGLRARAYCY